MKFLIPIAVLAFAINSISTRLFQVKFPGQKVFIRLYQALFSLFAGLAFFIGGGFAFPPLPALYISGILFGLLFFFAVCGSSAGFDLGSMSLTGIICNMSLILPILYSCLWLGESMNFLRYLGLGLILITMVLSSLSGEGSKKAVSALWLFAVLLSFFSNGATAIIQKNFVLQNGKEMLLPFMAIAYFTAALLFALNFLLKLKKEPSAAEGYHRSTLLCLLLLSLCSGLGSFGGNALLGLLSVQIDGALLYPCLNGGLCLVGALASFLFFKEKPTLQKLLAMATGIAAIVVLNL